MGIKRMGISGPAEIIDDIKATAQKLGRSASGYMINLHAMKQEKKYPGRPRGAAVSLEVVRDDCPAKLAKPAEAPVWAGGFSKTQQLGKK